MDENLSEDNQSSAHTRNQPLANDIPNTVGDFAVAGLLNAANGKTESSDERSSETEHDFTHLKEEKIQEKPKDSSDKSKSRKKKTSKKQKVEITSEEKVSAENEESLPIQHPGISIVKKVKLFFFYGCFICQAAIRVIFILSSRLRNISWNGSLGIPICTY